MGSWWCPDHYRGSRRKPTVLRENPVHIFDRKRLLIKRYFWFNGPRLGREPHRFGGRHLIPPTSQSLRRGAANPSPRRRREPGFGVEYGGGVKRPVRVCRCLPTAFVRVVVLVLLVNMYHGSLGTLPSPRLRSCPIVRHSERWKREGSASEESRERSRE